MAEAFFSKAEILSIHTTKQDIKPSTVYFFEDML